MTWVSLLFKLPWKGKSFSSKRQINEVAADLSFSTNKRGISVDGEEGDEGETGCEGEVGGTT